jgi:hypothetical protein
MPYTVHVVVDGGGCEEVGEEVGMMVRGVVMHTQEGLDTGEAVDFADN